jgi:prophage regulatory protein
MAERFLSFKKTCDRVGLSRATIYRWQELGKFPQTIPLGEKRVAFRESEVDAWMTARIEAPSQRDERRQRAQQVRAAI